MATDSADYVGRFAPSPTGPLHFGSLLAAAASYLQAKRYNGQWLLRIEDIDPPRELPGSDKLILDALEDHGFQWDGGVSYQSHFIARHEEIIAALVAKGLAYPCSCSRRDLADEDSGPLGSIYPGTCREGTDGVEVAYRLKTDDEPVKFTDLLQGRHAQKLESESGDFVIKRRDGRIAYHLAVVVDDHYQGVTEVVRGIDLLDSTPRQIFLQRCLGFPQPAYMHIPVASNADGQKLSKLTGAAAVDSKNVRSTLLAVFRALGQTPAKELSGAAVPELWNWAVAHWDPSVLINRKSIPIDQFTMAASKNGLS
jgi:glutamyl-Q tRNA(Asp) synthetase